MKFEQQSMAEGILTWNAFGPLPHSNNVLLDGEVARLTDPRNVVQEAESNSQVSHSSVQSYYLAETLRGWKVENSHRLQGTHQPPVVRSEETYLE